MRGDLLGAVLEGDHPARDDGGARPGQPGDELGEVREGVRIRVVAEAEHRRRDRREPLLHPVPPDGPVARLEVARPKGVGDEALQQVGAVRRVEGLPAPPELEEVAAVGPDPDGVDRRPGRPPFPGRGVHPWGRGEDETAHAAGRPRGELDRDDATGVVPEDVGALDAEMVEHRERPRRVLLDRRRRRRRRGGAHPGQVERDEGGEVGEERGELAELVGGAGRLVDEQERRALAERLEVDGAEGPRGVARGAAEGAQDPLASPTTVASAAARNATLRANTPLDETIDALDTVVRSGKARYIGVSNFLAYRLARALGRADVKNKTRFVSIQPRYSLLFREIERELLPLAQRGRAGRDPL